MDELDGEIDEILGVLLRRVPVQYINERKKAHTQLKSLITKREAEARVGVKITYYEHGRECQEDTFYLELSKPIQIQLDRMPGHFMQVARQATLSENKGGK